MKYSCGSCQKSINCIIVIFLLNYVIVGESMDVSLEYEVEGNGFHRTIRYKVDTGKFYKENCYLALHLSPDPTLYVNVDEVADLRRHGEITACSDGEIDVEVFAEKAGRQNITICSPLRILENILILPIHQRYRLPRYQHKFVNISLPKPVLLLGCKERIKEYTISKLDLCTNCVDLSIKWREIPYKMKANNFVWMVPVGDLGSLNYVTWVTLFTVWSGTFFILRALWSSRERKGDKKD